MESGRVLVVYYSRTGATREAAESLAAELGAEVERIGEPRGRRGPLGYLRSAWEATRGRAAPILPGRKDPGLYRLVVVASPVWNAAVSSPVRAWLRQHRAELGSVAFLLTYGGSGASRAFRQMREACGRAPLGILGLRTAQVEAGEHVAEVEAFAERLTSQALLAPAGARVPGEAHPHA